MSLLVWLPLNGDLNNQGLSNAAFAQYNSTGGLGINNSGKISQNCYERTSITNNAYRSNINFSFAEDISMCCWAYVSSTSGDSANGLITNHNHVNGSGFGITVKHISATDYRISCSAGKSGDDRVYHSWYGTTNIKGAWHHLALTYKRSTGDIQLYVDGVCEKVRAGYLDAAIGSNPFDLFNWSTGNISSTNYRPLCKLNDVRLYDHCLSAKEVKEISKGLVCHLPLNGGEGGVNLIKGIAERTATSAGVVASGDSLTYDSSLLPLNSLIGRTFTFTYDYSVEGTKKNNATGDISKDRFGAHLTLNYKDSTGAAKTAYPGAGYLEVSGTGRAVQTYTCSSTWTEITSLTIAVQGFNQPASGNNNTWYIKNFKIEVGNADTGYSINPNTLGTSVKLTDCSGYGHHGIPSVLPPSYRKDTTRYNASYDFVGGKKVLISNLPTSGLANSYTISWWAKAWSFSDTMFWGFSDGNRLNYYKGLYCNTGDGSNNPYQNNGTTITVPTTDVWHYYTMVGNGSTTLLYLDGNLYGTALNYRSITGSSIYLNGWGSSSSYNFNGYMSDFRIYATALSASDIKELYQIPISVDKSGNAFAIKFTEDQKPEFHKNGTIENSYIHENEADNSDTLKTFHIGKTKTFANQILEV